MVLPKVDAVDLSSYDSCTSFESLQQTVYCGKQTKSPRPSKKCRFSSNLLHILLQLHHEQFWRIIVIVNIAGQRQNEDRNLKYLSRNQLQGVFSGVPLDSWSLQYWIVWADNAGDCDKQSELDVFNNFTSTGTDDIFVDRRRLPLPSNLEREKENC